MKPRQIVIRFTRVAASASIVLLALFFFLGLASGQTLPDSAKVITPGGYQALVSKIGQTGSVRLIVKIDAPFHPMARPETSASHLQMGRISSVQDTVLSDLAAFKPKASYKYRYAPYIFIEVDERALQALLALPQVVDVQEDVPHFPTLDGVDLIGAPHLWDLYAPDPGFDGSGVTVAVLDTGVDKTHPFLSGAVVFEACYSTNAASVESLCPGGVTESTAVGSALPYASGVCPSSKCNHGTHVSGIIAGRRNVSGAPVAGGVAPGASLIAIQVFSLFTSTADCGFSAPCVAAYTSDIMKGLERVYALHETYTISSVNMSFGGGLYSSNCDTDPTKPIIDSLRAAGIASVISSGNDYSCGSLSAPACISSAVSVGATDAADAVAGYSNSATFLSLLAPGGVFTDEIRSSIPGDGYGFMYGTSMAAPHVSGAWALMKQAKPGASVDQVLAAFTSTGPSVTDSKIGCTSVTKRRIKLDSVDGALSFLGSGPSAETTAATGITQTGATLNGTVNANNVDTAVNFEYGTTTSYGNSISVPGIITGTELTPVSQSVGGLTPDTLYHYRVNAGTFNGNDVTFTTAGTCASISDGGFEGGTPNASWAEASTNFGTPLCTFVSCPGKPARAGLWFASFGGILAPEIASLAQNVLIPSGSSPRLEFYLSLPVPSSGNNTDDFEVVVDDAEIYSIVEGSPIAGFYNGGYVLTGLDLSSYADDASHTISFRSTVTGTEAAPTTFLLDDVSITCGSATVLPLVTTDTVTSVLATGARLNGTVNANNVETAVTFEYGPTTEYGGSITAAESPISGNSDTAATAMLTGLTPGTTYHYRIVGSSVTGRAYGSDMTFDTSCSPGAIKIGETPYNSVQSAIDSASDGDVVKVKAANFIEDLSFSWAGTVSLKGGFDCAFVSNNDYTTVSGKIIFGGTRKVIIENIIVR